MIGRAGRIADLLGGRFTPFLKADWGPEQHDLARRWARGERFAGARAELAGRLRDGDGGGVVVPLNLGRSALQLALDAMRLPARSGVILPSYACAGVVLPVLQAGLTPVLADMDATTLNLTVETVRAVYEPEVRAVIVPHLAGVWADVPAIAEWARPLGVRVIEDAAHAQGLVVDGTEAGTLGDAAIFSCGGGKPLFGPGGGWLRTTDPDLVETLKAPVAPAEAPATVRRRLDAFVRSFTVGERARGRALLGAAVEARLRGASPRPAVGGDGPSAFAVTAMADVEAAIAASMVPRLPELVAARRRHATIWQEPLGPLESQTFRIAPRAANTATKLWLSFRGADSAARAVEARDLLWRHGVETEDLYVPLHRRAFVTGARTGNLATTEALWRGLFCVPVRPSLRDADRARIAEAAAAVARLLRAGP